MSIFRLAAASGYYAAWDLLYGSYSGVSFDVSSQDTAPKGLFFKPDGTKMYVTGTSGDDVNEYDLSSAWDISTASYNQNASVVSNPFGLFFKPDGTKMYVISQFSDVVNEYDLSSPWDISTASNNQNFSVSSQDSIPTGLFFKPDGTKMYVAGKNNDNIYEYDLSSAWDISTASYNQNFSFTDPEGIFFKPDGTKMYVSSGFFLGTVSIYDLSSAWNVSTAGSGISFSVDSQDSLPHEIFFKPDGRIMYVLGDSTVTVYQYNIG